jgi:hypothetical protein
MLLGLYTAEELADTFLKEEQVKRNDDGTISEVVDTNYTEVKDAIENGSVLCKIQNNCGDVMPPSGKMSQGLIDMIISWKNQGYVE